MFVKWKEDAKFRRAKFLRLAMRMVGMLVEWGGRGSPGFLHLSYGLYCFGVTTTSVWGKGQFYAGIQVPFACLIHNIKSIWERALSSPPSHTHSISYQEKSAKASKGFLAGKMSRFICLENDSSSHVMWNYLKTMTAWRKGNPSERCHYFRQQSSVQFRMGGKGCKGRENIWDTFRRWRCNDWFILVNEHIKGNNDSFGSWVDSGDISWDMV